MNQNRSRGFTLIELLVVIAIIGVLSAVVLASLNTARTKGSDAAINSDLQSARTQAEIYYDGTGVNKYNSDGTTGLASAACAATANTVFAETVVASAITGAITANGGTAANVSRCAVASSGATYAIAIQSKVTTGNWFCIDSTGASKTLTVATPALGGAGAVAACP